MIFYITPPEHSYQPSQPHTGSCTSVLQWVHSFIEHFLPWAIPHGCKRATLSTENQHLELRKQPKECSSKVTERVGLDMGHDDKKRPRMYLLVHKKKVTRESQQGTGEPRTPSAVGKERQGQEQRPVSEAHCQLRQSGNLGCLAPTGCPSHLNELHLQ